MNKNSESNKYFIMMRGIPGTGKSTFSKAIAGPLRAVIIENDAIKNQIRKLLDRKDASKAAFLHNKLVRKVTYLISYELLSQNINANRSVIFDSCAERSDVHKNCKKLAANGHTLIVCECLCSDLGVWRERIKKRSYPWQLSNFKKISEDFKKVDIFPARHLIRIDTSKPLNNNVKKFLKFVRNIGK